MDQGIARFMDIENLCPDLEFAVARGIDLMQTMHPPGEKNEVDSASATVLHI